MEKALSFCAFLHRKKTSKGIQVFTEENLKHLVKTFFKKAAIATKIIFKVFFEKFQKSFRRVFVGGSARGVRKLHTTKSD